MRRTYTPRRPRTYTGASETFASGDQLTHGKSGKVVGHPPKNNPAFGKGLNMKFAGHKNNTNLYLNSLSRSPPPPLPGGYAVGQNVVYTGESQTFTSGDELTHGQTGEVVGLPPSDQPTFGKGVSVKFPGHKNSTDLYLTSLRRAP